MGTARSIPGARRPPAPARARTAALALALLLGAAPGCSYFRHVGKDAGETIHLGVGASLIPGLWVGGQVPVFTTSLGYLHSSTYVGTDFGHALVWRQAGAGTLLGGQLVRTTPDVPLEEYWSKYLADAYLDRSHWLILDTTAVDRRTHFGSQQLNMSKVTAGAHVLFVGVSVGVDILEVLDFVTGLFTWDLLGDDDYVWTPGDVDGAGFGLDQRDDDEDDDRKRRKKRRDADADTDGDADTQAELDAGPDAPASDTPPSDDGTGTP